MAEGRSNAAIAAALSVVARRRSRSTPSGSSPSSACCPTTPAHRRVQAVLTFLRGSARDSATPTWASTSSIWRIRVRVCACGTSGLSSSPARRQRYLHDLVAVAPADHGLVALDDLALAPRRGGRLRGEGGLASGGGSRRGRSGRRRWPWAAARDHDVIEEVIVASAPPG